MATAARLRPARTAAVRTAPETIEVSVVLPCLNEAETLAACIDEAVSALSAAGIAGEVIVADNGSDDGSGQIALAMGARLVRVEPAGYGSALRGGIATARGRFVLIGDADGSYDFGDLPRFLEKLRDGYQLVMGNRFQGGIAPGAMPFLHRWLGNPLLSLLGRWLFGVRIGDFHCGLRAFDRASYERLHLASPGMEFASEMVLRAALAGYRIAEVPTPLRLDGRNRKSHLRTWRDGWRHLRFMLLFSPRWLFLLPGLFLLFSGVAVTAWLLPGAQRLGHLGLDIDTLLVSSTVSLLGYQLIVFAVFSEVFAVREGFRIPTLAFRRAFQYVRLETGLATGALMLIAGLSALLLAFQTWHATGFGSLDPRITMRMAIPGVTLVCLSIQTIFSSFFLSILGIPRGPAR